jgi:HSP20 family molecular chaperone IbpA
MAHVQMSQKDDRRSGGTTAGAHRANQVDITPDHLVITGKVGRAPAARGGDVHLSEFKSGLVFRTVHFPKPVDTGKARAEYRNGLLIVTAPMALEGARRLEMKVA